MTDEEKLEKLKKLADAMYYAAFNLTTDASLLRKAMEEYRQFIIHEYHKEEPVSEELEEAVDEYAPDFSNSIASKAAVNAVRDAFKAGANWQKEQIMANSTDATIGLPYKNKDGGYTHLVNVSRLLPVGDNKIAIIFKEN